VRAPVFRSRREQIRLTPREGVLAVDVKGNLPAMPCAASPSEDWPRQMALVAGRVDVQFTYEGLRSVAELSNENGAFILRIIKEASNPESVKETERLFGGAVKTKGRPEPMNVNFHKSKFDERLLRLSVLRAAYLAGIAIAGYRWIRIWDPIRRQILDSTIRDEGVSGLVRYEQEYSRERRSVARDGAQDQALGHRRQRASPSQTQTRMSIGTRPPRETLRTS
jgi:hypothetical protein